MHLEPEDVFPSRYPASVTELTAVPCLAAQERASEEIEIDVMLADDPSSTAPILPRVVPVGRESVDDYFWTYTPPPRVLPRIVRAEDVLGKRPSFMRRLGRATVRAATVLATLAAVLTALALVLSWTFKIPIHSFNAYTFDGHELLAKVGPVEPEAIVVAPLAVQPHAAVNPTTPPARTASAKPTTAPARP